MGWFFKAKQENDKDDDVERRLGFSKQLQTVTNKIHATNNVEQIMLDLSPDICDLFNCDRLTLYAVTKDKEFIFSRVKTGINTNKDLVLPLNTQSIAGYVALLKCSVRVSNVYDEAELKSRTPELTFCREVDQITGYQTKQMLAAPLINPATKEALGVVQLINNREDIPFSDMAEDGLEQLCETMTIAFVHRLKSALPATSKYEPLVEAGVISAPELELAARSARRKKVDVEDILVEEFQVGLTSIGQALAKSFAVPYEPYKPGLTKSSELHGKLTRQSAEDNQWIPIASDKSSITILTTDPDHVNADRVINKAYPYFSFYFRVTTNAEFARTVHQLLGD